MRQLLIQSVNAAVLVIIVIGIPAITSLRFGSVRLSSDPKLRMLTLGGLGLAAAANLLVGEFWVKGRKERNACRAWALLFVVVLTAEYCYIHGYIGFRWLKEMLLWMQSHL